jgi:Ca2+-binding RTX toxin-like protein
VSGTTSIIGGGRHHITVTGNETIAIFGHGHDTIDASAGSATVYAASGFFGFGTEAAVIQGGTLEVNTAGHSVGETAIGGTATLQGGFGPAELAGGSGATTMIGGFGRDTFIGGSGSDYMVGGFGSDTFVGGGGSETMVGTGGLFNADVFAFEKGMPAGNYLIQNFAGQDKLYLQGYSLQELQSGKVPGDGITVSGGNTIIKLDGGATTITLDGVTDLKPSDIITHKHC